MSALQGCQQASPPQKRCSWQPPFGGPVWESRWSSWRWLITFEVDQDARLGAQVLIWQVAFLESTQLHSGHALWCWWWRCEHFEEREDSGSLESTGELGFGPHVFKINALNL